MPKRGEIDAAREHGKVPRARGNGNAKIDSEELAALVTEIAFTAVKALDHALLVDTTDEDELRVAFFVMQERMERIGWIADRINWRAGFMQESGSAENWMLPREAWIEEIEQRRGSKPCEETA